MKNKKITLFIFIIIFCITLVVNFFIAIYVKNSVADDIFILSFKEANSSFSLKDIEFLKKENHYFSFSARSDLEVSSTIASDKIEVLGTNENFAQINMLPIIHGSFFNDIHEKKLNKVAVLSDSSAWNFFGSVDCVGNVINISDEQYQIIGVFENNAFHKDKEIIYIPYGLLEKNHNSEPFISEIFITQNNISEIEPIIKMMGYLVDDIRIFAMEQYKSIIRQRVQIINFLIGFIIIIYLLNKILHHIKTFKQEISTFLKKNYITNILAFLKQKYIRTILLLLLSKIIAVYIIFNVITFNVCIPYYLFSINKFNLNTLNDILEFFIQPHIMTLTLSHLNNLNLISNLLFFCSISFGLIILLVSYKFFEKTVALRQKIH